MGKYWLIAILFLIFFKDAYADGYSKRWKAFDGDHVFSVTYKYDGNNKFIHVQEVLNKAALWSLNDNVKNCSEDVVLDFDEKSFEVIKINDVAYALFSYKIGCVGGIDPVEVKYFAYGNNMKYALRGEEKIVTPDGSFGGAQPQADKNLLRETKLLNYMLNKWKVISLRVYK